MATQPSIQIPQEAFDWYDEYAHGVITRRVFLERLASLAAMGFAMSTLTAALLPNYANAEQVSFNDADIKAEYRAFPSPDGHGEGRGYWVAPANRDKPLAAVLVVHENRGLNPYIEDVARRLAKAGFIAFAPDALFSLGGYPGNDDAGREMQRSLDKAKIEQDFMAAAAFLKAHAETTEKIGVVGFCFGGYIANMLAARMPDEISASVPFYGTPPDVSIRANIKAPLLIHLAELDERVNATWPDYEASLKAGSKDYQMHMYPGVNHGFHNDSTARYNPEAAELAWQRTLAFFTQYLTG